ncbi:MAG: hypothetical protein WBN23_15960 [Woeseia sp.]
MGDFEAAVDQMLSGTYDGSALGQELEWESSDFDLPTDYESYGNYENDDGYDALSDTGDNELFAPSFEASFSSGYGADSDFEWNDDTNDELEFEFADSPSGGLLSEADVQDLANDLVGVATPQEMEAFFGKLFKKVGKVAGKAMRGGLGQKLLRAGSGLIGRALPVVGSALGTAMLPGIGTGLGGALGGQLKNLFSRGGRRSLGRSLTRTAIGSARRAAQGNPLLSMLAKGSGSQLRSLFGFEMEYGFGDPQLEIAKRVVRTVADAADIAGRSDDESDSAIAAAFRQAADNNLPVAVRAAMLAGPNAR